MDPDKKIEGQFQDYLEAAKQNKNVDVATLMMNTLNNTNQNLVSSKQKKWAYLISIGLPPFGFLYALKFYFGDEEDAKHVGNVCIILTCIGVLSFWLMAKSFFSSSGASLNQIQQIKVEDIRQLNR